MGFSHNYHFGDAVTLTCDHTLPTVLISPLTRSVHKL